MMKCGCWSWRRSITCWIGFARRAKIERSEIVKATVAGNSTMMHLLLEYRPKASA